MEEWLKVGKEHGWIAAFGVMLVAWIKKFISKRMAKTRRLEEESELTRQREETKALVDKSYDRAKEKIESVAKGAHARIRETKTMIEELAAKVQVIEMETAVLQSSQQDLARSVDKLAERMDGEFKETRRAIIEAIKGEK